MGRPISLRVVREKLYSTLAQVLHPWQPGFPSGRPSATQAELVFFRSVAAWEVFLSQWFVAACSRNPQPLLNQCTNHLSTYAHSQFGPAVRVTLHLPSPTLPALQQILDPRGRNLTFGTLEDFKAESQAKLDPKYSSRVLAALPAPTSSTKGMTEAATSIRNSIAHNSNFANGRMAAMVSALTHPGLQTSNISSVGSYLMGHVRGNPNTVVVPGMMQAASTTPPSTPRCTLSRLRLTEFINEYIRIAAILVPCNET